MKLTSLQESLFLLIWLQKQIRLMLIPLGKKGNDVDNALKFPIINHVLILICSFLEEWKRLEQLGSVKKIQIVLEIASPYLGRIRKWRGLQKVRSSLLAHPHRDKKRKIAFPWKVFSKYECPTEYAEIILLGKCAIRAVKIAYARHHDEYIQAVEEIQRDKEDIERKGIRTEEEVNTELNKLVAEEVKIREKFSKKPKGRSTNERQKPRNV